MNIAISVTKNMQIFKLTIIFCFFYVFAFGQKTEGVFYNYSWGVLGGTETLLIPQDTVYVLQRNYLGVLGGRTVDTLYLNDGVFIGSKWKVTFTKREMLLEFTGKEHWTKKMKFKEYGRCDPFIKSHFARKYFICT